MSVPIELAADLLLNVKDVARAQRDIEKTVSGAAEMGLSGAIKATHKELKKSYASALVDALKVGHKEQASLLRDEFMTRTDNIARYGRQMAAIANAIESIRDEGVRDRLKEERRGLERLITREQDAMRDMIDERKSAQEDIVKLYEEGMEKAGRKFEDKAESAAESFTGLVNKGLTLDSLNPDDLIKSLGQGLKKHRGSLVSGGKNLMARGAKMGGTSGKVMAGMGKFAAKLGAMAGVIAGAAVAIAGVVAVLAAGYGKVKAWNKMILESASAYDVMQTETGDLERGLGAMRTAMTRVSRSMHISAEEAFKFVGAMNEAGLTVRELKGYTDATTAVIGYTRAMTFGVKQTEALGISTTELATLQQRMLDNFGMRMHALDDSMADFGRMAQMAGMNSRSFVAAIMEGTANMALYNFRLEDTGQLLVALAGILGEDMAKGMLQMEGTFKNMSTQDRYKASMTGGQTMENVLQAGARRQIEGRALDISLDSDMAAAFRQAGLTDFMGEFDIDKLASLNGLELGRVQEQIRMQIDASGGDGAGAVRGLEDLTMQARLLSGGATTSEKADAMGAMDRPTEMAAKVAQGLGMMGAEDFGDITGVARMQFEELTGIMGEEFESTKEIFNIAQARLSESRGRDVSLKETLEQMAIDPGSLLTEEQLARLSETPPGDPVMDIAKQTLMATQTIGDILGGEISGLLGNIGSGVTTMMNAFLQEFQGFVGNNEDAREAIVEADQKISELSTGISDTQEKMREVAQSDMSDEDKEEALAQLQGELDLAERKVEGYEQMKSDIQNNVMGADDARAEFLSNVYGGAEVMTQVRESVLENPSTDNNLGGAITSAGVYGQLNSRNATVDYTEGATVSGFLDGISSGYVTDRAVTDDEGNQLTQGDVGLENVLRDPEAMMEFMEEAHTEDVADAALAQEAAKTQAKVEADQLKEQEDIETGIRDLGKEMRTMTDHTKGGEIGDMLHTSGYQGSADFRGMIEEGKRGSDLAGLKAALTGGGGISVREAAILRSLGISVGTNEVTQGIDDFIYRGGASGGIITPIHSADEFIGMKPGGAVDQAGGLGGKSIVIQHLNIYESGDPQETLRMVKRALRAADA